MSPRSRIALAAATLLTGVLISGCSKKSAPAPAAPPQTAVEIAPPPAPEVQLGEAPRLESGAGK